MNDIAALQEMIRTEYGESLQFVPTYTPEQVEAWVQVTCELHSSDAVTMTMIHALLGRIAELESQRTIERPRDLFNDVVAHSACGHLDTNERLTQLRHKLTMIEEDLNRYEANRTRAYESFLESIHLMKENTQE